MTTIDNLDLKILKHLQNDHRIRASELSDRLKISRGTLRSRIRKLVKKNILKGFISVIDPRGLGFDITTFFFLKTNPQEPWLLEKIIDLPHCDFVAGITGKFSLLCRLRLRHEQEFGEVMSDVDSLMARSGSRTYRIIHVMNIFKENRINIERAPPRKIDQKDFNLLKHLVYQKCTKSQYTPLSSLQLAPKVGLSQPTVYKRLKRLETDRILLGCSIDVNWIRIQSDWIGFVVQIKVAFDAICDVAHLLAQFPEVHSLYRTTEEYLLLGLIWVQNVTDFNQFLLKCYEIPGIEDTHSLLMLNVHIERSSFSVLETSSKNLQ